MVFLISSELTNDRLLILIKQSSQNKIKVGKRKRERKKQKREKKTKIFFFVVMNVGYGYCYRFKLKMKNFHFSISNCRITRKEFITHFSLIFKSFSLLLRSWFNSKIICSPKGGK